MRKMLVVLFMGAASPVFAQESSLLSIPGLADLAVDAIKHSRAIGLLDLHGNMSGGSYIPLRKLHDGEGKPYAAAGFGATIKDGENVRPRFVLEFDISQTWRKLEGKIKWYESHIDKLKLPDIWIGISPSPPLDRSFTWGTWQDWIGVSISVGI